MNKRPATSQEQIFNFMPLPAFIKVVAQWTFEFSLVMMVASSIEK